MESGSSARWPTREVDLIPENVLDSVSSDVGLLHEDHPLIRAADWRSPLVYRLLKSKIYKDGQDNVVGSFLSNKATSNEIDHVLQWSGLGADFAQCVNTYQEPVLTEFASLGLACILVHVHTSMAIVEVTRRGDRVDYWIGADGRKEILIEIGGRTACNLDEFYAEKVNQLCENPFKQGGYVCVVDYETQSARLWFCECPGGMV